MKILHLADLHFGKRIDNLSLIEDQKYINEKILAVIDEKKIGTVLISGDVYDRFIPSEEAVALLDEFLYALSIRHLNVLIIAGNHDSDERLAFGDRLIENAGIYISPVYDGKIKKVILSDEYGNINFFLLPFIKPTMVARFYPDENINSYTDAVKVVIDNMHIDEKERNIILSHQFVTGAHQDGSEDELFLGGTSNVDSSVYEIFDYTALGHIHRPQNVKGKKIRYAGSPIKFSFNEEKQNKALTIVELKEKGDLCIELIPLELLRDFITLKGNFEELRKGDSKVRTDDFVNIILTDEEMIPNAFSRLSMIYPNIQRLSYENKRTANDAEIDGGSINLKLSPNEMIKDFYKLRNGQDLSLEQTDYLDDLIEKIWGGEL